MPWPYTKREDGKVAITLDNNVWNFLHNRNIDLSLELPHEAFAIFITREVEIETLAIPSEASKSPLKDFIDRTIKECGITTTRIFGFDSVGPGPQRYGGFGIGMWQSQTEREFYEEIQTYLTNQRPKGSGLKRNEGDAAVAAKSFSSIALTCERRDQNGPLRYAAEHGGNVLYLDKFDMSGLSLRSYIEDFYRQI